MQIEDLKKVIVAIVVYVRIQQLLLRAHAGDLRVPVRARAIPARDSDGNLKIIRGRPYRVHKGIFRRITYKFKKISLCKAPQAKIFIVLRTVNYCFTLQNERRRRNFEGFRALKRGFALAK